MSVLVHFITPFSYFTSHYTPPLLLASNWADFPFQFLSKKLQDKIQNGKPGFEATFLPPTLLSSISLSFSVCSSSLTQDLIYERHPDLDVSSLRKLDLPNCGLKHVDLSPIDSFRNLARYLQLLLLSPILVLSTFYLLLLSLNLEHNSLTSFSGLIYLNKLKVHVPAQIHFLILS